MARYAGKRQQQGAAIIRRSRHAFGRKFAYIAAMKPLRRRLLAEAICLTVIFPGTALAPWAALAQTGRPQPPAAGADAEAKNQTATQTAANAATGNATQAVTEAPELNLGVARALDAMLERARSLIGTRYRTGGNSPETGFDCSGFAGYLYRDILGFHLPRSAHEIWKFGKSVERNELRPGDLVFYNTLKRPYSHVGIYLGDNRFIHSPTTGGRVNIVEMEQRYWATRWNGAKRVVP